MLKLRKELQNILTQTVAEHECNVYYEKVKKNNTGRYVIFTAEVVTMDDFRKTIELEINCIDTSFDTSVCETIADAVTKALDHREFITESIGFYCYLNRRNTVAEPDEKIVRRRLTFDLYLYERN